MVATVTCRFCGRVNYENATNCALCGKFLRDYDANTPPIGSDSLGGTLGATLDQPLHWLVAEGGALKGERFSIGGEAISVGRHPTQNKVVINDPEVSRIHARIFLDAGKVVVEDCSANGTYVNEERVERATLAEGDSVRFGLSRDNLFSYKLEGITGSRSKSAVAGAAAAGAVTPAAEPSSRHYTQVAGVVQPSRPAVTVRLGPEDATLITRGSLQLVLDQYAVENIPLAANRVKLGRAPAASDRVQIDHPTVSDAHAEITVTAQGAMLRDLASINGTFVNGERISERLLADGDLIQLGDCTSKLLLYRHPKRRVLILRDLELRKPVMTLGRDPGNDIKLDHPTVSRHHAEIRRSGSTVELIDKGSDNGTFVNGVRIKRQPLNPRDKITLGAVHLVFDGSQLEQQSDGTRVRLTAHHLTRTVTDAATARPVTLLDDISLVIEPREFVGLLGPVGSGKSTLMHALNGFQPADSGRVTFNSWNLYEQYAALRSVIGYVPQDDIVHKTLTVRECLYYAARLRLPDDYQEAEIRKRVTEVVEMLDLNDRIDVAVAELSGGQRKRVSVGIELLSKPSILFLDEPTGGQDPRTEMRMMQLFRQIANRGSTVVITTHLLGSFSLLDKIAVLNKGKLAYFGPGLEMLHYFQTSRPHEVYEKLRERSPDEWAKRFRESELHREFISRGAQEERASRKGAAPVRTQQEPHSRLRQLGTLVSRQFTAKLKDWKNAVGLLAPPIAIAMLSALIAGGPNEPKTLLMIVFAAMWFGCSASVREIVDEVSIYRRERQRGLSMLSYLGSKLLFFLTIAAAQSALFITVLTLMDAQANHFLGAWLMMTVMTMQGVLIGLLISALARNSDWALYAFPLALIPQLLLAGLLIPVEQRHPFNIVKEGETPTCTLRAVGPLGYCREDAPRWTLSREMPDLLKYGASPVMAARWGLEGLADLYVHDYAEDVVNLHQYGYSFQELGAVYVTFHADDETRIRSDVDGLLKGELTRQQFVERARPAVWQPYAGILALFAVVMLAATAIALRRKDHESARL